MDFAVRGGPVGGGPGGAMGEESMVAEEFGFIPNSEVDSIRAPKKTTEGSENH